MKLIAQPILLIRGHDGLNFQPWRGFTVLGLLRDEAEQSSRTELRAEGVLQLGSIVPSHGILRDQQLSDPLCFDRFNRQAQCEIFARRIPELP